MHYDTNNWVNEEMSRIEREKAEAKLKKKHRSLIPFIIFVIILSFLYSHSMMAASFSRPEIQKSFKPARSKTKPDETGAKWKCQRCLRYNYSENPDWQGKHYCTNCGCEMGKN